MAVTWKKLAYQNDVVTKALFDANSILAADSDNTPAMLTIAEQRLVGRITSGNITALTATQVKTLLGLGSMATQAHTSVDIDGGAIDGVTIGGASAAALTCTTFTSDGIDDNADANAITISSDEEVTMPSQPAFLVNPSQLQSNIATNSSVTIVFDTEAYDIGSNFASNTFTAPITGRYLFVLSIRVEQVASDSSYFQLFLITTSQTYIQTFDLGKFSADPSYWMFSYVVLANMSATDTAYVAIRQQDGTQQTDIHTESVFSGILLG